MIHCYGNKLKTNMDEHLNICNEDRKEREFDTIIGHIEDILIEDGFHVMIENFMENHWRLFDDSEENKLIYTVVFNEYTNLVERYITSSLIKRIPSFSMERFIRELERRRENLEGEIFDVLFTMSDFLKFKEVILDFKHDKDSNVDLNLCITRLNTTNH